MNNQENISGGKMKSLKQLQKSMTKGMSKVATTINPFNHLTTNKTTNNMLNQTGVATHDYILPSVVAIGKPIAQGIAGASSTLLTGNPMIGKVAFDSLYNNMVSKPGYDPTQNQKSKLLGDVSNTIGNELAKPVSTVISGAGIHCYLIGQGLKAKTLKNIIYNGYHNNENKNIDGYELDKQLSGKRVQVYHNPNSSHTVVNHRGTQGLSDWITDANLALFYNKSNKRFKHSKAITDKAKEKYSNSQFTHVGHSLGTELMHQANLNNNTDELIKYNGVSHPYDILKKQKDNEYNVRTGIDPVSALDQLKPFQKSSNNTTIRSDTYNPISEHSSHNLDRLDPEQIIGKGIKKSRLKFKKII